MTHPAARRNNRYAVELHGRHIAPSVTTVIGVLDKPALAPAAAKETAIYAVTKRHQWQNLSRYEAVDLVKKHHRKIWDEKANRGTVVHELALAWSKGLEVDVTADCVPYIDALERFYLDWHPRWVEAERTVVSNNGDLSYGGSFDGIVDLKDGYRYLIDLKTGKGIWPTTALQLAAYRHAPSMGIYDKTGDLVDLEPMKEVERCAIVHLQGNGSYALVPVEAGNKAYDYFLNCRRLWNFQNTDVSPLGEPLVAPKEKKEVRALSRVLSESLWDE